MQQPRSVRRQPRVRRAQTMRRKPRRLFRVFCRRWSTLSQEVRCDLCRVKTKTCTQTCFKGSSSSFNHFIITIPLPSFIFKPLSVYSPIVCLLCSLSLPHQVQNVKCKSELPDLVIEQNSARPWN